MDKGREQGSEQAEGCKDDAERIDGQCAGKVLPDGAADTTGHTQGFNKTDEIVAEQHDIGAFPRHIRTGTHRNTHARLNQSRSIVHAVAYHGNHSAVPLNQNSNALKFFFGERFGHDFADAELAPHGISHSR